MKSLSVFAVLGVTLFSAAGCKKQETTAVAADKQTVTLASYKELQDFFQTYGYTFAVWRAGYRAVPRLYVTDIPEHWAAIADQVTLKTKKELFYSAILPLVLQINELIAKDRARAEPIAMQILAQQPITSEDRAFLSDLAARYRIPKSSDVANPAVLNEILLRVDAIPPSLALAQAAFESAYATSRFAGLGNSLYGQETKKGKGIEALGNEDRDRPFQMADFDTPLGATQAYAHNLNTNKAYKDFRKKRAEMRRLGKPPDSVALAMTLTLYCERGIVYCHEIVHVLKDLNLPQADMAFLRDMKPVYIAPKSSKTKGAQADKG